MQIKLNFIVEKKSNEISNIKYHSRFVVANLLVTNYPLLALIMEKEDERYWYYKIINTQSVAIPLLN